MVELTALSSSSGKAIATF